MQPEGRMATMRSHQKQRRLPRGIAAGAIRISLIVCRAIILLAFTHVSSAAEEGDIHAQYELAFAGLTIAKADVRVAIRDNVYTVRVNYRTSGAARLMGLASGEAVSSGAYKSGHLVPATFDLDHQGSQRTRKINVAMSEGSVSTMTVDPPVEPGTLSTPITGEHLKNVTDPLSALFLPAIAAEDKSKIGPCDRTVPVFDGLRRFDVTLKQKETRRANRGPYVGVFTACEVQITHIAGQMQDENNSRRGTSNRSPRQPEIGFGILNAHRIYIPVSFSARVGFVTVEAYLTQLSSSPSK